MGTNLPELRATITEMLKEALGDHKADKGKQKSPNQEVGSTQVSLGRPSQSPTRPGILSYCGQKGSDA